MSTRNMTMVIDRDYASNHELGFAQNPELLTELRVFYCSAWVNIFHVERFSYFFVSYLAFNYVYQVLFKQ